jgi:isocitrate/isopropylmalate dehydrogenase
MTTYRIARIGGDGIGPDVVAEAARVLEAAATGSLRFTFEAAEVGAALYRRTGEDLPREAVELCRSADAVLFGAAGLPDVRRPDGTELVPQDVMVTENMFGDILSDLGAATVGGLGMAPSGDIGDRHAVFQPSHGSAPDIAGKGIANPVATILSAAMLCRWLGGRRGDPALTACADRIEAAVGKALADPRARTRDIGGTASTREAGEVVIRAL